MSNEKTIETIATPPQEVRKIQILQNREFVIEAIRKYYQITYTGADAPGHYVIGSIRAFFLDLEATLKRQLSNQHYQTLAQKIFSDNVEESINGFRRIEGYLDELNVTIVDTRKKINSMDAEEENESKGL